MKFYLNDYGAEPDSSEDSVPAILALRDAIAKIPDGTEIEIALKKGTYHFYPSLELERVCRISNHEQFSTPRKIAFLVENRKSVTFDGEDSELIFHGVQIPFAWVGAENCGMKNCSIDFEFPQIHQFVVESVDSEKRAVSGRIDPYEPVVIGNGGKTLAFGRDGNQSHPVSEFMSFESDGRLCWNIADRRFHPDGIEEKAPGRLTLTGFFSDYHRGNVLALRPAGRPAPGIFLDRVKNFSLQNVRIHYAFGMGLLAQNSENIALDRFCVCRRGKDDPRLFTTNADATHFSGCKGVIRAENGLYEGMADDAINVHGTYLRITERLSGHAVRAAYMQAQSFGFEWGKPGEEVVLICSETMEYRRERLHVSSIRPVDSDSVSDAKSFEIEFEENLPEFEENRRYGLENLTRTPEVLFRNNTIRSNRARGALFSTPKKVVCEQNFFDHVHGSAILLCGDCNGWFETGACHDVLIRQNRFRNNLTALYQFTEAVISIDPVIPELEKQNVCFHSGIRIEENLFETFDHPLLYAKSAEHILFQNNKIVETTDFQAFHKNRTRIVLIHSADFRHKGNLPELTPEDIRTQYVH